MFPCYMIATKGTHKLGDISRIEPSLCLIIEENEMSFIGSWVFQVIGAVNIEFPKETTRKLTAKEMMEFSKTGRAAKTDNDIPLNLRFLANS